MKKELYPLYLLIHPIDGYEELKYKKRFSVPASFLIVLLFFLGEVFRFQCYGFGYNSNDPKDLNVLFILARTILLFILWCLSNWLFCSLTEGKGFFKEVWAASAYALTPYVLINYIATIISNVVVIEEITFVNYLFFIGVFWSVVLMLIAMKTIHEYSLGKVVFTLALTLVGVAVVLFLLALSLTVYQQVFDMFRTIVNEILYRL